ncbi:MAG: hypothetical protein DHS80DRAFT_24219 [Piptocephalis tieghemiana]|nr:MAG: hypothetical protein DHS80DRAFT_24219 [Piptocephalis tieghemiana]
MWTYVPTEGYDPSVLMPKEGLILWILLSSLWGLAILAMALTAYRYRHTPAVMNRCSYLTLMTLPSPILLLAWVLYRPLVSTHPSCFMDVWCFFLGNSFSLTFNFCRFLRILHIYHIKEALLDADQHYLLSPDYPASPDHSDPSDIQLVPKSWSPSLDPPSPPHPLTQGNPQIMAYLSREWKGAWWFRYRHLLSEKSLILLGSSAIIVFTLILFILTMVHGPYPDTPYAFGQCLLDWPLWIAYMYSIFLKAFLYPASFVFLRKSSDAYGVRREFRIYGFFNGIFTLLCFATIVVPNVPQPIRTPLFLSFFLLYLCVGVYSVYILPLLDIIRAKRQAHSAALTMDSFQALLRDPSSFHAFLHFSVWDLSVENPLFYRRYHQLALRTSQLSRQLHSSVDSHLLGEACPLADKARSLIRQDLTSIYTTFLSPSSHHELNIPKEMAQLVERQLAAGNYQLRILDDILHEVTLLMFQHTYPRFLEQRARIPSRSITFFF